MKCHHIAVLLTIILFLCGVLVPVAFGPVVLIAMLLTVQILWLLQPHIVVSFLSVLGAVAAGVMLNKVHMAWIIEPYHMMLKFYPTLAISKIQTFIFWKSVGLTCWKWLGNGALWKLHAPFGAALGSLGVFLYQLSLILKVRSKGQRGQCWTKGSKDKGTSTPGRADVMDGTLIGMNAYGGKTVLTDKEANQHALILGTTGAGKTVTVCNIVESAINRGIPVIYIDGKGDDHLAGRIGAYTGQMGKKASIFSMHKEDITYNPLATGGFTSKKDRIVELREWTEKHYKKLAEGYLQCVFKVMECCDIPCNMVTLAEHLDLKQLQALVRKHEAKMKDAPAMMQELSHQEGASKSIESLVAEIRNFSASEIGQLFKVEDNKPVLTLDAILQEKTVAYFSLPALEFPSMAKTLGKLVINDLKATIARRWSMGQDSKVYVIFDEFSVFAGEQVLNVINMGRGAGIHAILCTQSLSDIASARSQNANHFLNQVVGNCNNFILHRQNSPEDAEIMASIIGTRNSTQYTVQVKENEPTDMGTLKQVKEFIVHPDDIKRLGTGEAFFYSKAREGVHKLKVRKSEIC